MNTTKKLMTLLLALLAMNQAVAQEYEYVPFVREGVKWMCDAPYIEWMQECHCYFTLELKGDTVINGKTYKAMHKYSGDAIDELNDTIPVYLREENKVVYGIVPDGKTYSDCPVGVNRLPETVEFIQSGQEFILYDFNEPIDFIKNNIRVQIDGSPTGYIPYVVIPDTEEIAGKKVNRYIFGDGWNWCYIEGIGCDGIGNGYPLSPVSGNIILCNVIENGETIYISKNFDHRPYSYEEVEDVLPIPRQNVQWVNERVIVQNGDTTQFYYKYEFNGLDKHDNAICYSYTSDTLDKAHATIVAKYQCYKYMSNSSNGCIYENKPFGEVKKQGRNMIGYTTGLPGYYQMYCFDRYASDIDYSYPPNYYIYNQRVECLTRQNLIEVEPLIIEGIECERYAYLGEDGDTLAYIVQGIGFDSRDMGDLLTPFTLKPDPNAEVQEWWGLSHVVKDGKIIYKGMRYRPGAFDEGDDDDDDGDVNGDGDVNITDANSVIEIIINGGNGHDRINEHGQIIGDVNLDGVVNITDLNYIIQIILTNN